MVNRYHFFYFPPGEEGPSEQLPFRFSELLSDFLGLNCSRQAFQLSRSRTIPAVPVPVPVPVPDQIFPFHPVWETASHRSVPFPSRCNTNGNPRPSRPRGAQKKFRLRPERRLRRRAGPR